MIHIDALPKVQIRVLKKLGPICRNLGYYLAGGTDEISRGLTARKQARLRGHLCNWQITDVLFTCEAGHLPLHVRRAESCGYLRSQAPANVGFRQAAALPKTLIGANQDRESSRHSF